MLSYKIIISVFLFNTIYYETYQQNETDWSTNETYYNIHNATNQGNVNSRIYQCYLAPDDLENNACKYDRVYIDVPSANGHGDQCKLYLNKLDFLLPPRLIYPKANPDKYYIVLMMGPTLELKPNSHFLHWIVSNVKGSDLLSGDIEGDTVVEYLLPVFLSGPNVTNLFYKFYIYRQEDDGNAMLSSVSLLGRINFLTYPYFRIQNVPICGPVAGNQYQSDLLET